MVHITSIVK